MWTDEAEIKLGDSLLDKLREGIDSVEYVLVILSKTSIGSPWVNLETQEIEGKRVKVFVVLYDAVQLHSFLMGERYADLRSLSRYNNVTHQIVDRVTS